MEPDAEDVEYIRMLDSTIALLGPRNASLRAMLETVRSQYRSRERSTGQGVPSEMLLLDLIGLISDLEARIHRLEHGDSPIDQIEGDPPAER